MKTISLDKPWTYRTAETTIDFPKGDHPVKDEIYKQAVADGVIEEKVDGGGAAKDRAAGATGKA